MTVAEGDELNDQAGRMLDEHVRCLVVTRDPNDRRTPVGIIAERDVVSALARFEHRSNLAVVAEAMSTPLVVAKHGDTLEDALGRMTAYGVRHLPVVDGIGALVGMVSFDDYVEELVRQAPNWRIVALEPRFDATWWAS